MGEPNAKMAVSRLRTEIERMTINIDRISSGMRSLDAVDSNSVVKEFRELRDDTRNAAREYLTVCIPIMSAFVGLVKHLFANYLDFDYEDWCENLEVILVDTTRSEEVCERITMMIQGILVPLKRRQDQAGFVIQHLEDMQMQFEKRKKELEKSANEKSNWAVGLIFFPVIGWIASGILSGQSKDEYTKAAHYGAEAKIQQNAARAIKHEFIPALDSFIRGVQNTVGSYAETRVEISKFQGRAGRGLNTKKLLHYRMMRRNAIEVIAACDRLDRKLLEVS